MQLCPWQDHGRQELTRAVPLAARNTIYLSGTAVYPVIEERKLESAHAGQN